MTKKAKILMIIADLLSIVIGLTFSIVILVLMFLIINFGRVLVLEPNIVISTIEFGLALFATILFCYKAVRFLTKKEVAKYLYK